MKIWTQQPGQGWFLPLEIQRYLIQSINISKFFAFRFLKETNFQAAGSPFQLEGKKENAGLLFPEKNFLHNFIKTKQDGIID